MISLWDKFDGNIESETAKSVRVCKAVFQPSGWSEPLELIGNNQPRQMIIVEPTLKFWTTAKP